MQRKHKKFVQCIEEVLWLTERVKSGLWSFLLEDAPRSGRPVEVVSDHIETLIEHNQRYITRELAYILKYPNQ